MTKRVILCDRCKTILLVGFLCLVVFHYFNGTRIEGEIYENNASGFKAPSIYREPSPVSNDVNNNVNEIKARTLELFESEQIEEIIHSANKPHSFFVNNIESGGFKKAHEKQNLATSGKTFRGEKTREFPEDKIKFRGKTAGTISESEIEALNNLQSNRSLGCEKWGVVTTIFEPPSEAVRRFMYRKDWCVVVVGDKGKPSEVILFDKCFQMKLNCTKYKQIRI